MPEGGGRGISETLVYPPVRGLTRGPKCHFFGYYDKSPWDATGRYVLGLETTFMDRPPTPKDRAVIGLIDKAEENTWRPIARTVAWNWQQGAMLQWLPSEPDRLIVYNDRREDRFVSVVRNIFADEERVLPRPVYALSPAGGYALSTNFARIADTRPGYGYVGLEDPGRENPHPADDGIFWMDLETGEHRLIISYAQAANFRSKPSMNGAKHWFNHIQVNTDGSRFAFLHRWCPWGQTRPWETRLLTADPDGSGLYSLADDGMVSHYDWRDPTHILAWARQEARPPSTGPLGIRNDLPSGEPAKSQDRLCLDRFFLFTDRSKTSPTGGSEQRGTVGEGVLTTDGHCSYSPERQWILTDTYPDEERMRTLILYRPEDDRRVDIGRFFAPKELDGEIRCDLHPRWSRDGHAVCFDSVHEGARQMYVVDVSGIVAEA